MRDQQKICREEWFKNHVASVMIGLPGAASLDGHIVTIINWQKPGTWNYGCRFIIHAQWLCVVGDIGEAVYQWGQQLTLEFLGKLNFDYFHGKCRASDTGRQFRQWDPNTALKRTSELRKAPDLEHRKFAEEVAGMCGNDQEFKGLLHVAVNEGRIDYDLAAELSECGFIPSPMAVAHYVGLQMAIKQLLNPVTTVTP